MQSEQELPIDIHTNKLLEWLISRRHCNREWQENVRGIREKINNAIQDMPAVEEIAQLLAGSYITYFHCLRIVELLKETESSTKNIFGRYSSQRMKDWLEILKLYEKDNLYIAEAAQMLIRNVNYEIPSLKKQIVKCQQTQEECTRRETDLQRNANEYKDQYNSKCKQMGIEGKNIKNELLKQVSELPAVFDKIVSAVKNLEDACQYYEAFAKFTVGKIVSPFLPMIRFIMEFGNATTYQWRTGQKPKSVENSASEIIVEEENSDNNGDTIDFCDDIEVIENTDDIDFGDIEIIQPENGDGIDWESDQNANQINFDITAEIADALENEDNGVARGNDALSVLDNVSTRSQFIDELMELEAFLDQRLVEMQSENDLLSSNRFQAAPVILQLQTVTTVSAMLAKVKDTLDPKFYLLLILSSPRYVDRLVDSLQKQLAIADKMLKTRETVISKRHQAVEEQQNLEPKLELIIARTHELQKNVEEEISKKYKNRPVNIMGGINTI